MAVNLTEVAISGFRSIRNIRFAVRRLTVLVGGNGVGKTNLYRSLELLHAAAIGNLAAEIAREGGLASVLYAGERARNEKPRLALEATMEDDSTGFTMRYAVEVGFPQPLVSAAFANEAQIKEERALLVRGKRPVPLMDRDGPTAWARDAEGKRIVAAEGLLASETALSSLRGGYPEVDGLRADLSNWRFYHGFRTDADSPLRQPARAITSPLLASDGSNLAAVFATLRYVREESPDLDAAIEEAFPGARLDVPEPDRDATFSMTFPDLPRRSFGAHELSDGTLHYLALTGALLAYRLPPFIALNEPETSLHPRLLPALAKLIAKAAERTQVWVVTHSVPLAEAIAEESGIAAREVVREDGATWIAGLSKLGVFPEE